MWVAAMSCRLCATYSVDPHDIRQLSVDEATSLLCARRSHRWERGAIMRRNKGSQCDGTADIYGSNGFLQGVRRLGSAVFTIVYGSRNTGRFRPTAFAKHGTNVLLKMNHFWEQ